MSGENNVRQFVNEELGVNLRVVDRNGQPWFVGNDVARALGYMNPQKAIRDHCKGVNETFIPSQGGEQQMKIIAESDVYRLVLRSKLPLAEAFQDWIVEDVLPSIRKHGAYMSESVLEKALRDPESILALAQALLEERNQRQLAEQRLNVLSPRCLSERQAKSMVGLG